jgi:hypothetical protein
LLYTRPGNVIVPRLARLDETSVMRVPGTSSFQEIICSSEQETSRLYMITTRIPGMSSFQEPTVVCRSMMLSKSEETRGGNQS